MQTLIAGLAASLAAVIKQIQVAFQSEHNRKSHHRANLTLEELPKLELPSRAALGYCEPVSLKPLDNDAPGATRDMASEPIVVDHHSLELKGAKDFEEARAGAEAVAVCFRLLAGQSDETESTDNEAMLVAFASTAHVRRLQPIEAK